LSEHTFGFGGTTVAHVREGRGFPVLMIHGSGPGASSYGNWARVQGPLAEHFEIHTMDLIGFGKSGRKPAPPYFDFALWTEQAREMLRRIPGERVGLIGHSISGAIALRLAAVEPRVARVLTTGSMGAPFEPNAATVSCWTAPRSRDEIRRMAEGLIHDASVIDEPYLSAREKILFAPGYADYFDQMFEGDKHRFVEATLLHDDELAAIEQEVLMIHGRDDTGFPAGALTLAIAPKIRRADALLLAQCSHSVAFEQPRKFVDVAVDFFKGS
jgi:2-hydroxymuconate-semialdehyde hydrolase